MSVSITPSQRNPEKAENSGRKHELIRAEVLRSSSQDTPDSKENSFSTGGSTTPTLETNSIYGVNEQTRTPAVAENSDLYETSIWKYAASSEREGNSGKRMGFGEISTIFVIGNKGAGKTSLINCFLEKSRNSAPRPTFALDFSFARRTTSDFVKQVSHIWELGGDAINYSELLETPIIYCRCLEKMSMVVVLDLSQPNNIWATLEFAFLQARKALTKALTNLDKGSALILSQELESKMAVRLRDAMEDKDSLEPFAMPAIIIGTKYDIFQSFEPEKRKTICRLLRIASHRFGASLNFYAKGELSLNRRIRELFCHCAFGTAFPKEICLDMMSKPLLIPFGGDSFQQIWPGVAPTQLTLEYCRHLYETKVGKSTAKFVASDNPSLDPNFKEFEIDQQRQVAMEKLAEQERLPPGIIYSTSGNAENAGGIIEGVK